MTLSGEELAEEVLRLKKEKNAVILAHNYQVPEVQEVADFVGDSLELAQKASQTHARIIVFCGVDFMAETAKILNPKKKVVVPDKDARCPMADLLKLSDLIAMKKKNLGSEVVLYVNTHADAKAECDCVCTSANADKIVAAMDSKSIIFGPDENLAYFVKKRVAKSLMIVPPNGICPTHQGMSMSDLFSAKQKNPKALVVVHPECIPELQDAADVIASTAGILKFCRESDAKEFIIGTENGMLYRLEKEIPEKKFYPLSKSTICPNMKRNTLQKVLVALEKEGPEVTVPENIRVRAEKAIKKMLEISKKQSEISKRQNGMPKKQSDVPERRCMASKKQA